MVNSIIIADDLIQQSKASLSQHSRLSTTIPGFVPREQQIDFAVAVAKTITLKKTLIAEVGTGTGKTFAYLIPCLLSGKKALISTATKTLQDQLFQKDVPMLVRALGLPIQVHNLKGRANYLCRYRLDLYVHEGRFNDAAISHAISQVQEKLPRLTYGERSELPEINENSPVWPYVTSTVENCLGKECTNYQDCFLVKARKKAMDADLVIINHHLFFADSSLKEDGFGELLPGADIVIFDEAHQIMDIAIHFNSERLSTRQFNALLDDFLKEWPALQPIEEIKKLTETGQKIIEKLFTSLFGQDERISWERLEKNPLFKEAWKRFLAYITDLATFVEKQMWTEEGSAGLTRCVKRLNDFKQLGQYFSNHSRPFIRWCEHFKNSLVFHLTPFDISAAFKALLAKQTRAYVFTSATLTCAQSFIPFTKPLGLNDADSLLLPSPFNYFEQTLLYLPRTLPDPKDDRYYEALVAKTLPIIEAYEGRCFFLFTSHKALKIVAQLIANKLNYPLLVQGEEAKSILLSRFRELGNAVLLGTATFWEGIDVKGDALSCVIIDKIPFTNPLDPVMRGKMAYLKKQGLSAFDELSLPSAVLALKQGIGRLIRDADDKGVLVIADPRLSAREYGRQIFASFPVFRKTRDEQTVLNFIKNSSTNSI